MRFRTIASATAALIVLAGCPNTVMVPAELRSVDCRTGPGARCDVAVRPGRTYTCETGRFDVDPDYLRMRGGQPVSMIWRLPDGFAFCAGDGVYLSHSLAFDDRQVLESFGSNSDDGSREPSSFVAANCSTNWNWNYRNQGEQTYKYGIQFTHKASGRKCVIDPFIKNGR